jgi:hypothetical protein
MEGYIEKTETLPQSLIHAIERQKSGEPLPVPEGDALLSLEEYAELREQILSLIAAECVGNAYHYRPHTEGVEARFMKLAMQAGLSPRAMESGALASLLHDLGHPGVTIRQEALEPFIAPQGHQQRRVRCLARRAIVAGIF